MAESGRLLSLQRCSPVANLPQLQEDESISAVKENKDYGNVKTDDLLLDYFPDCQNLIFLSFVAKTI